MPHDPQARAARAERVEQQLTLPVLAAALVSVPAVFLTMAEGTTAQIGHVLNWASMLVIVGESLLLVILSGNIRDWAIKHKWMLLLAAMTIPAVIFAVGPVQLLRLVLSIGAFRILRVGRIMRAGRIIRDRTELGARKTKALIGVLTAIAAVFVAVTLADPSARSRRAAEWTIDQLGVAPALIAGLLLGAATYLAVRHRKTRKADKSPLAKPPEPGGH